MNEWINYNFQKCPAPSFPPLYLHMKWGEVTQSLPTLCDPMDCSLPGFSIHRFSQARIMEWVAISFSRGSSWPRDWTPVSCIIGRLLTLWATREVLIYIKLTNKNFIYLIYTTWCFDMLIHSEIIAMTKLINISITSHISLFLIFISRGVTPRPR